MTEEPQGIASWRPLIVKDQTARSPSGPVRVPAVKVVFMLSGWARVQTQGDEALLEPGSILTIPSALECQGFPAGHARTVTLYLHPEYLGDQMKWLPVAHPLVHHLRRAAEDVSRLQVLQLSGASHSTIAPTLVRLANRHAAPMSDFELLGRASVLFDTVGRLAGATPRHADTGSTIPRTEVIAALTLLRADLRRPWRIKDLAREIALSPSQLTRLFRDQIGVAPGGFLRQLRADRMAELLASTSLNIREAGAAVGWDDPAVASRAFKQRYGVSPRAYAMSYRKDWNEQQLMLSL